MGMTFRRKSKGRPTEAPGAFAALHGADLVAGAVMVDQAPIGRTTRSNPASYVGAFDAIRDLFGGTGSRYPEFAPHPPAA